MEQNNLNVKEVKNVYFKGYVDLPQEVLESEAKLMDSCNHNCQCDCGRYSDCCNNCYVKCSKVVA